EAGHEAQVLEGARVRRVRHRDRQRPADPAEGEDVVLQRQLRRDEPQRLLVEVNPTEIDRRDTELAGQDTGQVVLGYVAELDERIADAVAVLASIRQGGRELFTIAKPLAYEEVADAIGQRRSGDHRDIRTARESESEREGIAKLRSTGYPVKLDPHVRPQLFQQRGSDAADADELVHAAEATGRIAVHDDAPSECGPDPGERFELRRTCTVEIEQDRALRLAAGRAGPAHGAHGCAPGRGRRERSDVGRSAACAA